MNWVPNASIIEMMKKYLFLSAFLFAFTVESFGWGQNGHRVVGQLAEWHLNKKAKRKIDALLGHESLPMVANWLDEIRADQKYNHTAPWHYLTIEDGKEYDPAIQEKGGNAYEQTLKVIASLKEGILTKEQEIEYLKMLVHLVGDLHQPLHVGREADRGGNTIDVAFDAQGNGILVAGGVGNTIERNRVWNHDLTGIGLVPFPETDANDVTDVTDDADRTDDTHDTDGADAPADSVEPDRSSSSRARSNSITSSYRPVKRLLIIPNS